MKNISYFLLISFGLMAILIATAIEENEHKQNPSRLINGRIQGKVYHQKNEHDLNIGIDGKNNRGKKLVTDAPKEKSFKVFRNPTANYFYGDSKKYNTDADDGSNNYGAFIDSNHQPPSIDMYKKIAQCLKDQDKKNIP